MTSPESRPRVEGEQLTAAASGEWWGVANNLIPDLARDLLDARAEVERLRGVLDRAVEVLHGEGMFVVAGEFAAVRAALRTKRAGG